MSRSGQFTGLNTMLSDTEALTIGQLNAPDFGAHPRINVCQLV